MASASPGEWGKDEDRRIMTQNAILIRPDIQMPLEAKGTRNWNKACRTNGKFSN